MLQQQQQQQQEQRQQQYGNSRLAITALTRGT